MRTSGNNKNKIMRIITVPIKVLCKARDRYVKSINDFADKGRFGNISGPAAMPRSFSVSGTMGSYENEDDKALRLLTRALSTRSSTTSDPINTSINNNNMDHLYVQQQMRKSKIMASRRMPRSCSVGMGKIDEDEACDFEEENVVSGVKPQVVYPRSRSYTVDKRKILL